MAKEEKTSKKAVKDSKDAKKSNDKKASKKTDKKKSKKNPFKSIASFFKSVNAERKKVVWPNAKETIKNTIVVLIVVSVAGLAIYGIDTVLSLGMEGIKKLADNNNTTVSQTAEPQESSTELVNPNEAE